MPSTTGPTASRCEGLEARNTSSSWPDRERNLPLKPLWYLTSPGTLDAGGVQVAFELPEQLLVALAHDVYEHIEAATMGHAHYRVLVAVIGRGTEQGVEKRYRRLGSFQAEPLLPDVLGLQKALEGFGGVELGQDMTVLFGLEVGRHALDVLLDPPLLRRVHNVHVLDADRPAICVPQEREDIPEPHLPHPGQALRKEFPVEVPHREAVSPRVKLGVHYGLFPVERVQMGYEVAPYPVGIYQALDLLLLFDVIAGPLEGVVHVPAVLYRLRRERPSTGRHPHKNRRRQVKGGGLSGGKARTRRPGSPGGHKSN